MSQTESFRARREALVLRLRDQEKLTFQQIGNRFDRSACRAAQIYQAARRKIQFPPNGLSNRLNHLLSKAGFTVEKQSIASALRAGKLYPQCYPPTYGIYAHRDLCEWAGVAPATVPSISSQLEGEEMKVNFDGFDSGDRTRIELPAVQVNLLKALYATGKPVVFVDCSGSAIAMPWAVEKLPAIVQVWYPGEEGGRAVADVLFGNFNPSGKLPITFYGSTSDLPSFEDYSMTNRTYRYFTGRPEYAFGHGLSYTKFSYDAASLDQPGLTAKDTAHVSFSVKNTGSFAGDEVAQVYFRHVDSAVTQPQLALCGFTRVHLEPHQATRITVDIPAERFRYWDTIRKQYVVEPGHYQLLIGGASDDIRLKKPFDIVL